MSTLRTIYRAFVMVATGVIVVQGWQLYGPPKEQVKSFALSALQRVQSAWNETAQPSDLSAPVDDPRSTITPLAVEQPLVAPLPPPGIAEAPQLVPLTNGGASALFEDAAAEPTGASITPAGGEQVDQTSALLTRLRDMGAPNAQVGPWGSEGELFRCSCKAKIAPESPMARHFEAVAEEPGAAVAQVVAKVEAWRTRQQNELR